MLPRETAPDFIKGVSIVLMVYGHLGHAGSMAGGQNEFVKWIYTFHMPMFLLVSGFYLRVGVGALDGVLRIFRRLWVPYFVFISIYLFGLLLVQYIGVATSNPPPESFVDYLRVVLLDPRGAYWFIHSLIIIQLVVVGADVLAVRLGASGAISLVLAVAGLAVLCQLNLLLARTVCYFVLGMILRSYAEKLPSSLPVGLLATTGLFLFFGDALATFSLNQVAWCLSILVSLAGLSHALESRAGHSVIVWLGRNSMSVLVIHALFIVALKPVARLALQWEGTGIIYSLFVVCLTLLGSLVFAYGLDRIGATRYLFGVSDLYATFRGSKPVRR